MYYEECQTSRKNIMYTCNIIILYYRDREIVINFIFKRRLNITCVGDDFGLIISFRTTLVYR